MTERDHTLRHLRSLEDYRACVELQEEVWGSGFSERVPTAILKVAQALGGVSAGAFDEGGRLQAFVFGLTGLDDQGQPVHWSDMLAVRAGAGGQGLGTRLKWLQREAVMERGITRMLWTFDPLRARNAHLNLNKLGAVVREYREDMYGETDSELHRGIGTDRFVALWRLDSARVVERAGRAETAVVRVPVAQPPAAALCAVSADGGGGPRPGTPRLDLKEPQVGVAIPSDIGAVMSRDRSLAMEWRQATRTALVHYLERGYEVTELMREDEATKGLDGVATYLLEHAPTAAATPVAPGGPGPVEGRP